MTTNNVPILQSTETGNMQTIPDIFYCPLSMKLMVDPVVTPNGDSYERSYIEKWLRTCGTCPITRVNVSIGELVPNIALKAAIQKKAKKELQKQMEEDVHIENSVKIKPVANYPLARRWVSLGQTTNSFANVREVALFGNNGRNNNSSENDYLALLQSFNAAIQRLATSASPRRIEVIVPDFPDLLPEFPNNYDFSFIPSESERMLLINGYNTMNRIQKWGELRNFVVNPTLGFMMERNNQDIVYIMNQIVTDYDAHSGASIGCTMQMLHHISKYGLEHFKTTLY